jgi:hypothetical protein
MIPIIGPIISGLFGIGKQYLSNKAEKSQAKHKREVEHIKGDQAWDIEQAKNSGESWKDEYLTIITTAPFVTMFTAAALGYDAVVDRMAHAFDVLTQNVPPLYWQLLLICYAASFGVKGLVKWFNNKKGTGE